MNHYTKFEMAVELLKEANVEGRATQDDLPKLSMCPKSFIHEFCIVRVDSGRRAGKTEYIKSRIEKEKKSLAIAMSDFFIVNAYDMHPRVASIALLMTTEFLRGRSPDFVYVDEPSQCFKNTAEMLDVFEYITNYTHKQPTFVLLGH